MTLALARSNWNQEEIPSMHPMLRNGVANESPNCKGPTEQYVVVVLI